MGRALFALGAFAVGSLSARPALAGNTLSVGQVMIDRPTVITLGVQLLVSGDDNHDATVAVRYKPSSDRSWKNAMPLYRVMPADVVGLSVPEQFAGSIFDLQPGTPYDLELHVVDPDGVDQTLTATATTRAVPVDPKTPNAKSVSDAASLQAALAAAQPGDVITLAAGNYAGSFSIQASGTEDQPIVVRGADRDGVVLDGQGCTGCNVVEVYGSYVHVERLTIAHATRALRFQGQGTVGNAIRRVHVVDTTLGFGSQPDQKDFYLCDNQLEGRLAWPSVYADDGGLHANDDGIHVEGDGHVVCHNTIVGYGDAMKTEQDGARAVDFYGNDVLGTYDNGIELDGSAGNVRAFRNRFTNTYATLSFQPIFGGPAYAVRNVVVNVANEQLKLHGLGTQPPQEPSGVFILHNTFVSPDHAFNLQTTATTHHFTVENNLFVGPASPTNGLTVDWSGGIDDGKLDYDGFFPDGKFAFNLSGSGYQTFASFAAVQGAGLESNGRLVDASTFANGLVPPASYAVTLEPQDVTLAAQSAAIDHGDVFANIDDGFQGAGPDLGALELGCPLPIYGVRPDGVDESTEPFGCGGPSSGAGGASSAGAGGGTAASASVGAGGGANGATGGETDSGGCGCRQAPAGPAALGWIIGVAFAAARRRRRVRVAAPRAVS